jgi:hypothetical protein
VIPEIGHLAELDGPIRDGDSLDRRYDREVRRAGLWLIPCNGWHEASSTFRDASSRRLDGPAPVASHPAMSTTSRTREGEIARSGVEVSTRRTRRLKRSPIERPVAVLGRNQARADGCPAATPKSTAGQWNCVGLRLRARLSERLAGRRSGGGSGLLHLVSDRHFLEEHHERRRDQGCSDPDHERARGRDR